MLLHSAAFVVPTRNGFSRTIFGLFCLLLALCVSHSGKASELLEFAESRYNNIYVRKNGPFISMMFGHNKRFYTETVFDTRDPLILPAKYTQLMTVALAYSSDRRKLLEIGFGGGRTAWYLHRSIPTLDITAVELDPDVVRLAKKYFAIETNSRFAIEIMDGRQYLRKHKDLWDIIMIDAYRGPFVPFHLLTNEFFQLVKKRLKPGGVVVQNIEPTTMVFDAAIRTMGENFDHLDVFDAGGNVVVAAYDGDKKKHEDLALAARKLTSKYKLRYDLGAMIEKRQIVTRLPEIDALTDDFAPVESLLAIKRHNKKLLPKDKR